MNGLIRGIIIVRNFPARPPTPCPFPFCPLSLSSGVGPFKSGVWGRKLSSKLSHWGLGRAPAEIEFGPF